MKISQLGEFGLIHAIQKLSSRRSDDLLIGIGDDAAVLRRNPATLLLATTDMLVEGVHFDLSYTDFYSLGWKSAAVNLSDIAAMGGVPRFCLISLGIPSRISVEQILDFYRGFNVLMLHHQTMLAGGDTCSSKNGLVVSITALGEAKKQTVITRNGAKPGDRIFVTGTLGDSRAGLTILQMRNAKERGTSKIRKPTCAMRALIERHLRPIPRVEWGRKIALAGCATSMIDVSDGLSTDLGHICEESGVRAILRSDTIPFSESLLQSAEALPKTPLDYALSGGEDYELLFTVPPAKMKKFASLRIPATEIGTIIAGKGMSLVNAAGKKSLLRATGYDHFKQTGDR